MNSKLVAMMVTVGVISVGGVASYVLQTPQPSTRTMLELRDAGLDDGQKFVLVCPERLTGRTKNRIKRLQPTALRPRQSYARIARLAYCFSPDGGNCFNAATGVPRMANLDGEVVVPSLRRDLTGTIEGDDGGEDEVDDSLQFRFDGCSVLMCPQLDALILAGTFVNPYATPFCGARNRLAAQPLPNMMPLCIGPDGGWDDNAGEPGHMAAPDCKFGGPYGKPDGGPEWRGCNSLPAQYASGSACVPVEASVVSGDLINQEWL